MEDILSKYITLTLEIVLCASILGVIAGFGSLSYRAHYDYSMAKNSKEIVEDKADLYYFDNKTVNASDIVEIMLTNNGKYDYRVTYYSAGAALSNPTEERIRSHSDRENYIGNHDLYKYYWSEESYKKMVEGYEDQKFTARLMYSSDTDGDGTLDNFGDGVTVRGIQFIYMEG